MSKRARVAPQSAQAGLGPSSKFLTSPTSLSTTATTTLQKSKPASDGLSLLKVQQLQCHNLASRDNEGMLSEHSCDPYCVVSLHRQCHINDVRKHAVATCKTEFHLGTRNAVFMDFQMLHALPSSEAENLFLTIEVIDFDFCSRDDPIGYATMPITDVLVRQGHSCAETIYNEEFCHKSIKLLPYTDEERKREERNKCNPHRERVLSFENGLGEISFEVQLVKVADRPGMRQRTSLLVARNRVRQNILLQNWFEWVILAAIATNIIADITATFVSVRDPCNADIDAMNPKDHALCLDIWDCAMMSSVSSAVVSTFGGDIIQACGQALTADGSTANSTIMASAWGGVMELLGPAFAINRTLEAISNVCLVCFALEILFKLIGFGCCNRRSEKKLYNGYFRSAWNVFDFILVALSSSSVIAEQFSLQLGDSEAGAVGVLGVLTSFRVLRVLRPLRMLSRLSKLRALMAALTDSVQDIVAVLGILIFFFALFGVVSLQLWSGSLHQGCVRFVATSSALEAPNSTTMWDADNFEIPLCKSGNTRWGSAFSARTLHPS